VLIVDDHRAFAECLAMVIDACPDLGSLATATSVADGIALAQRLLPDIILLDVRLPDGDGVAAICRFRDASPDARVLILTGYPDLDVLARAAGAGASGFLQKDSPVEGIIRAIRAARDGDIIVGESTLVDILGRLRSGQKPSTDVAGAQRFTARELDVLALMGEGLDPHAIANLLQISLHTCRGYEKSIMAKLDAHSQLEAVVIALRRGLIAASAR
jgi:DNA-binding NarL/FixJ family response regulator